MPARACFKCGERGHLARDCTAPKERWLSERARGAILNAPLPTRASGDANVVDDADDGDADGDGGRDVGKTPGKRAATSRRPKFSVSEHLLGPNGLGVVYATFPDRFREASRGEGHERADLETLLAMYREWALKMYPYAPAEQTLARVSRLSNDKAVKMAVREFHERDFGGGVGERVAAMERGENVTEGEDVVFPDDEDGDDGADDAGAGDDDGFLDDDGDVAFPDDGDDLDEEDYVFEDEDAADAMREADAANGKDDDDVDEAAFPDDDEEDSDDDVDDEPTGKRIKQVKGATDSTKKAFEKLAKKLSKATDETETGEVPGVSDTTNVLLRSPQRKILRTRPKALDPSSDEEDEPEEPVRRRRAVHGMDDDDDDE